MSQTQSLRLVGGLGRGVCGAGRGGCRCGSAPQAMVRSVWGDVGSNRDPAADSAASTPQYYYT